MVKPVKFVAEDSDLPSVFWDKPNRVAEASERIRIQIADLCVPVSPEEVNKFALILLALEDSK
jgi:hypothetical protein